MESLTTSEARDELAEVLNRVAHDKERFVIRQRGEELAAVIPMEDLRLLERLIREEEDRIDAEEAAKVVSDTRYAEESVTVGEVKRELGLHDG